MDHIGARRTLVADSDKGRALSMRATLADHGRRADLTGSLADVLTLLEQCAHDALVLSLSLADGLAGLRAVCERRPGLAVIVIGDEDDAELGRAVLEAGAQEYVPAGSERELPCVIDRAVARAGVVERLHESEVRYRSLVEGLPGVVVIGFDRDLRVTCLEGEASRAGRFRLDHVGQPADEVFGVETMKRFGTYWERTLAGERFSVEWKADDDGREYVSHFAPIHDAYGNDLGGMVLGLEIYDRVEDASTLARYRRRHSELAEGMPVGVAEFDVDGVCRYVNSRYCEIAGVSPDAAVGRLWSDFPHPDDVGRMEDEWEAATAERREFYLEYRIQRPGGSQVWVAGRAREIVDEHFKGMGYRATIIDIEARLRAEKALDEATALFAAAFEHAPVGMGIFTVDGHYQQVNPALCSLVGRRPEDIIGRRVEDFVHPEHKKDSQRALAALIDGESDESEFECCLERIDGTSVWILQRTTVLRSEDGESTHLFAQMVDIGARHSQEVELRHLADHDTLTGLFNRRRFEAELTRHLGERSRSGDSGAVLLLDLDHFKQVNDEHGHHAGDRVLVHVAEVLRTRLRHSDVAGRLGGDEFAVLLREGDALAAQGVADMLTAAIAEAGTTASIGVAGLEPDDRQADEPLARADFAMYDVKRHPRAEATTTRHLNW
ncbi:MAG TPA: diguanylate cyclase [Solirubrobacteraceae bacterium]|nr:diguanylate cyclase [Solirubrobacteraceae bacterium]